MWFLAVPFGFLLIREKRKRYILISKRAKIPSPRPSSFLPFCFNARTAGAVVASEKNKRRVALVPLHPYAGDK